jgi:hypothetical protein
MVKGNVSFDGKPLPGGRVTFLCDGEGRPALSGKISADGSYEISHLPVGHARVAVQTFEPQQKPTPEFDPTTGKEVPTDWEDTGPFVPIPQRYGDPRTSALEHTIAPGRQTFDIRLTK